MTYGKFLESVELFKNLTVEEIDEISQSITVERFPKGALIIEEGTPGDSLYIIQQGAVVIERTRNGQTIRLDSLKPPRFFGEMSLIDQYPHSARAVAVEDCVILLINRLDLDIILNWNTVLGFKMWRTFSKVLSERLRKTNERVFEKIATAETNGGTSDWHHVIS